MKKKTPLLTIPLRREEDDLRDFEEMRERVIVMVFSIFRSFVIFVVIMFGLNSRARAAASF